MQTHWLECAENMTFRFSAATRSGGTLKQQCFSEIPWFDCAESTALSRKAFGTFQAIMLVGKLHGQYVRVSYTMLRITSLSSDELVVGSITLVCPAFSVAQVRVKLPRHPLASASMPKP